MTPESADTLKFPEALRGILENQEPAEDREAVSTSIECGTVEDIRITVPTETFAKIEQTISQLKSPSIEAKKAAGVEKLPARAIELKGNSTERFAEIATKEGETFRIPYTDETLTSGFGGGAFNSTTDAAIISQTLASSLDIDPSQIPTTRLYLTLQKHRHGKMRQDCQPLSSLKLNLIDGTPRRSVFIKETESGREIYFSTALGTITQEAMEEIVPIGAPKHIVLHNQPDAHALQRVHNTIKNSDGDSHLTWSLGSNQISDGIDRYQSHLALCHAFTCNLAEAVSWLRSSRNPLISEDPTLVDNLEESKELPTNAEQLNALINCITQLSLRCHISLHFFLEADNRTIRYDEVIDEIINQPADRISDAEKEYLKKLRRNLVPPKDPKKRQIVSQRAAQLISGMSNERSYVFLTDGGFATTVIRRKKWDNGETAVNQHYVPVLNQSKTDAINELIKSRGELPTTKDATGCGDCFTATVVALRQLAGKEIHATTIVELANHYTYLVYSLPYSNLLEIESAYPGIVKAVTELALSDLDESSSRSNETNWVELDLSTPVRSAIDRVLSTKS